MFGGRNISNKNTEIIKELAKAYYQANRGRNRILTGAAICGIVVLCTVFTIAFGKVEAEYLKAARENGGLATTYLERGSKEQYCALKNLDYIREVGKEIDVGGAYFEETFCGEIRALDQTAWEKLTVPAYTEIQGEYPKKGKEIMLSRRALAAIGIEEPALGMEIPLKIEYRLFYEKKEVFTLSGYFTDYLNPDTSQPLGYVSQVFAEELGGDFDRPDYLQILQKDGISGETIEQRLYADIDTQDKGQRFVGGNTFTYKAMEKFTGGWKIAIVCGILILVSVFLLIQNVMHFSMQKEIRQYGLLQTIGTTPRQLRVIFMRQVLRVVVIAGTLGGMISIFLIQTALTKILGALYLQFFGKAKELYIFRPEILAASILFVAVTIWIAAGWTLRRLLHLAPVEAMHYIGEAGRARKKAYRRRAFPGAGKRNRKKHIAAYGEVLRMAGRNLLRYPWRFAFTIFSLFLGITTALGTSVIGNGLDQTNEIQAKPDFALASSVSANEMSQTRVDWTLCSHNQFSPISENLLNSIESMNGVNKETIKLTQGAYFQIRDFGTALYPFASAENLDEKAYQEYKEKGIWGNGVTVQIADEAYLEKLEKFVKKHSLHIEMDLLRDGEGFLLIHDHRLSPEAQKLGNQAVGLPLSFRPLRSKEEADERRELIERLTPGELADWDNRHQDEWEAEEKEAWENAVTMKVAGYLDTRRKDFPPLTVEECYYDEERLPIYLLVSGKGFEKLGESVKTFSVSFDARKGKEPIVKQALQKLIKEENSSFLLTGNEKGVHMTAKSELMSEAKGTIQTNRIIMGALSAALIFMGIMNYFNIMATSLTARELEFSALRSIGMTARQLKVMLLAEGLGYALTTAGLVCSLGTGILYLLSIYLKAQAAYFVFLFPYAAMGGILAALTGICVWLPLGIYKGSVAVQVP
ncbi:ABC transporter permease [Roseburia hominis]